MGGLSEEGMVKLSPTEWNVAVMERAEEEHFRQGKEQTQRPRGRLAGFSQLQEPVDAIS